MTTAADRIQKAVAKRRTSLAAVARDANLPAGWVRSVATGHITKPDPVRLSAIADVLALDYRELLALTDQLGEAETVHSVAPAASGDLAALTDAMTRQADALTRQADLITRLLDRLDLQERQVRELSEQLEALASKRVEDAARLAPLAAPTQGDADAPPPAAGTPAARTSEGPRP